jgi:hypothetical protein
MKPVPTLDEWKSMSESDRNEMFESWNPYSDDGQPLLNQIKEEFRREYGHLRGLTINGIGNCHGSTVLGLTTQLVFDHRLLPKSYLCIPVYELVADLPKDFKQNDEYVWAPENYEYFVEHHAEEIRKELDNPNMSRDEMLSALCGMEFNKYVEICRSFDRKDKKNS